MYRRPNEFYPFTSTAPFGAGIIKTWNTDYPWSTYAKTLMRDSPSNENYNTGMSPSIVVEEKPYTIVSKLIAEFIGTAFFIFIGSLSVLNTSEWNSTANAAFAQGLTIAVLVAAFGHISGGHFNPAVSLSVVLSRKMKPLHFFAYVIAQLFGAFIGAVFVRGVTTHDEYESFLGGTILLPDANKWLTALAVEAALTTLLTTVVLAVGVDVKNSGMAPFAIGSTIVAGIFSFKSLSGACMNPARNFGPTAAAAFFLDPGERSALWKTHYVYWAGPAIGAAISAFLYRTAFARGYNRLLP